MPWSSLVIKEVFDFYVFHTSTTWICAYRFPVAIVAYYQNLSGLKQQIRILSQSKSVPLRENQSVSRAVAPWRLQTPGVCSLSLPASGGCWQSLICGHITPVSASVSNHFLLCVTKCPLLLSVMPFRTHLDNSGWSFHLRILNLIFNICKKIPFSK